MFPDIPVSSQHPPILAFHPCFHLFLSLPIHQFPFDLLSIRITYLYYLFFQRRSTLVENNHRKINTLEENELLKTASSKYLLNDVIAGENHPMYKLLPSSVIRTSRSTAQGKQQKKFRNPTIEIISDLNSNCQLHKQGDRRNNTTC